MTAQARPAPRALPAPLRAALARRALLLQAGWNFEGMQNLGFLYAIEPGLRKVYGDPERLRRAQLRHLGFFNTQPYMAGFAVGACLALEEEAAASGEDDSAGERIMRVKRALGSALAALGDPFFWGALRPATAALTVLAWAVLWGAGAPAPFLTGTLLGLAAYNAPALWARIAGPALGYGLGEGLPAELKRLGWHEKGRAVRLAGLAAAGLLAVAALTVPPFAGLPRWLDAGALAGAFALRMRGVPSFKTYAAAALLAAASAAVWR